LKVLAGHGADRVIVSDTREPGIFNLETDAFTVSEIIRKTSPEIVLFSATDYGRVLAPKVAAIIKCGITADCTDFRIDESGKLVQIRPALGGNILAHIISPKTLPQMATVRPGVFKPVEREKNDAEFIKFDLTVHENRKKVIEKNRTEISHDQNGFIEEAQIIVAAGFGARSKEVLEKIRVFSEIIGGVCGCSRRIVEAGLMPHSSQVGQSGKTVSPEIYIAIGISGAVQHIAGMNSASKIIAVNSDSNAEIFSVAHVGFVMDAGLWLDKASEFLRKELRNG